MIKYFRFSWDEVLWQISFANLNMLLVTIPVHHSEKKDEEKEIEGLDEVSHLFK